MAKKSPSKQSPIGAFQLSPEVYSKTIRKESMRKGFGRGLKWAADDDDRIVGLVADLTESVQMEEFAENFPERFIQVGVAEQNLVTVASGMASMGKIPFAASYAAFSPGRNWEQIRTTICINDQPVKIIGSHAGVNVGADGATHQMLEDIALMRVLPNMTVVAPADSHEAEKATMELSRTKSPAYMRLAREATPVFTTSLSPFEIGKAYMLREGVDVTLFGTGTMTYECLVAAEKLEKDGISAEVVHVPTIKPLDIDTIRTSLEKTKRGITVEEAQIAGGFGSAVCESLAADAPWPVRRMGVNDAFGESGTAAELLKKHRLTANDIVLEVHSWKVGDSKRSIIKGGKKRVFRHKRNSK